MNENAWGLGHTFWSVAYQCWVWVYFLAALGLLCCFGFRPPVPAKLLYGRRDCPGCGSSYDAPMFALNFGRTRYERCPHCHRWHWTNTRNA
jgi:hypothetical protein